MGTRRKARETYGSGSVTKQLDADGRQRKDRRGRLGWRVCVHLGTDAGGRRRKVQRVVYGTLEEARAVAKRLSEEYEHIDRDASEMGFAELASAWVASMENAAACSAHTLSEHARRLSNLAGFVPAKPLAELTKLDIEKALTRAKEAANGSQDAARRNYALAKRVFRFAVDSDLMVRNPCDRIPSPKAPRRSDRRSLSPDECARLAETLDADIGKALGEFEAKEARIREWSEARNADKVSGRSRVCGLDSISGLVAVRLLLATGMRRGEALGLSWGCVDVEGRRITVRQSVSSQNAIKEPKTAAGVRTLCIDGGTAELLGRWKAAQSSILQNIGEGLAQSDETPVFPDCSGSWFDYHNFGRWWNAYRDAIGFPGLRLHELRHTQATILLGNGADIKTVQTRLGHASASLTLDFYAHAMPANDKAAAELMGSVFGGPRKVA